jgi:hypothetical protein
MTIYIFIIVEGIAIMKKEDFFILVKDITPSVISMVNFF